MHLAVGIGAQRIDAVQRGPVRHAEPLLRPAVGATLPGIPDDARELLVGRPAAQRLPQIDALRGVQAEEPGAVCGDTAAIAGTAERRGDGGDDAEGRAVPEPESLGGSAALVPDPADRLEPSPAP